MIHNATVPCGAGLELAKLSCCSKSQCSKAATDCEECIRDCHPSFVDGTSQPLCYTVAGLDDWDPQCDLPGFEEAGRTTREYRLKEFQEIISLLDLKRCPNCGSDWSSKGTSNAFTPLLDEDLSDQQYSCCVSPMVMYRGKHYQAPFGELISKAISLCPHCSGWKDSSPRRFTPRAAQSHSNNQVLSHHNAELDA